MYMELSNKTLRKKKSRAEYAFALVGHRRLLDVNLNRRPGEKKGCSAQSLLKNYLIS